MSAVRGAVQLNYLGQFESGVGEGNEWRVIGSGVGGDIGGKVERGYELEITVAALGGELEVVWRYGSERYTEATMRRLARRYVEELRELITTDDAVEFSPSDFPLANLDAQQLSKILNTASFEEN